MPFLLAALCALCFGDWPQFRVPNADGHSVEKWTPMEWSYTKNVARKRWIARALQRQAVRRV